ncbi:MAG: L,D-transpeptidase [Bradyrhizobiaceae bacterium]|nr:L,D-transpeptidase [Bradyrhizobiaceae bacterium]
MRKFALLPVFFVLAAAPAAAQSAADPWAGVRVAQAGPKVIPAPRRISPQSRTARDYERAPVGQPDFADRAPTYRQPDLGGGFIEFLFTGRVSSPYAGELPRSHYMRPQVEMRPQYDYERRSPYASGRIIQARQDQPDVAAHPRSRSVDPRFLPQQVRYDTNEKPGTIIIDSRQRFLYLVEEGGMATRYGVGVGRDGFGWSGVKAVSAKKEWPDWRPPEEMLRRRPELPRYMAGGPDNPLGARALYLGDSLYRIHGSNEPWTIGQAVSSGCFRMRNEDVIDLYERVNVGTKVVVL